MEKFEESKEVAETSMHNLLETDVSVGAQSWGCSVSLGWDLLREALVTHRFPLLSVLWESPDVGDVTGLCSTLIQLLARAEPLPGTKQPLRSGGIILGGHTAGKGLGRISQLANPEWQEMGPVLHSLSQIPNLLLGSPLPQGQHRGLQVLIPTLWFPRSSR